MKLSEFARDLGYIAESLGTLQQLNLGPLINVARQSQSHYRRGPEISANQNKFQMSGLGASSEIIDVGAVKTIADLRKAYKSHEEALAFAVYIGGTAVGFGLFSGHDLAGRTRTERFAYDLTPFGGRSSKTQKQRPTWREEEPGKIEDLTGQLFSTAELAEMFTKFQQIAQENNTTVTVKLVTGDTTRATKRNERYSRRAIEDGTERLKDRLARYKLSKKPKANNIEEFMKFIDLSTNSVKQVQFDGYTYNMAGTNGYSEQTALHIMKGKPFDIRYTTLDPNSYVAMVIYYRYDAADRMIKPIYAQWQSREKGSGQVAVLDPAQYAKGELGGNVDINNKDSVIPALLKQVKSKQYKKAKIIINSLKQAGATWPELDMIDRSVSAELNKDAKA